MVHIKYLGTQINCETVARLSENKWTYHFTFCTYIKITNPPKLI